MLRGGAARMLGGGAARMLTRGAARMLMKVSATLRRGGTSKEPTEEGKGGQKNRGSTRTEHHTYRAAQ